MAKVTKRQKKLNEIDTQKQLAKQEMLKAEKLQQEFEEIVKQQELARDSVSEQIDELCKENNLYCGIILTEENLLDLLRIKFNNPRENIKIKFKLYIQEPELSEEEFKEEESKLNGKKLKIVGKEEFKE
ncbi:MAG: hypothetical protein NUV97_01355 [archaeon]|nr:hypothetical protein [archaeon]